MDAKIVRLVAGSSRSPEEGACLEQLVSLLADEPFSDTPDCADVIVIRWGMHVNDSADDEGRSLLYPFAVRQIGTAHDGLMDERALACCDWLYRTLLPDAFDWEGYRADAGYLRSLPLIDSLDALRRAMAEVATLVIRDEAAVEWALDLAAEIASMVEAALAADPAPGERVPYCEHPGRTRIELYADAADVLAEVTDRVAVAWEKRLGLLDRLLPEAPTVADLAYERCTNVPGLEALAR